jgi:hypothetical protein
MQATINSWGCLLPWLNRDRYFGFRSRASFCASAISADVIFMATMSRFWPRSIEGASSSGMALILGRERMCDPIERAGRRDRPARWVRVA